MAKILIVDDEDPVRILVREMLKMSNHEISEAKNGREAIEKYCAEPADLVITDLVMPDKSGIDLIMELKEKFPQIRILAISGGGGITGRFDYLPIAYLLGANFILKKPFKMQELRSKVEELLAA
jgi:YesN/AraC family two-component response regulator